MAIHIHFYHVYHKILSYLALFVLFYDYMAAFYSVGFEFMKCQRVSLASHISQMKFFFPTHGLDIKSIFVLCKLLFLKYSFVLRNNAAMPHTIDAVFKIKELKSYFDDVFVNYILICQKNIPFKIEIIFWQLTIDNRTYSIYNRSLKALFASLIWQACAIHHM